MRRIIKLMIGVSFLSLLVLTCNKDENGYPVLGYFTVDDTRYNLTAGFLENLGTDDFLEGYNMHMMLYSSGISVSVNGSVFDISGSGEFIYFEFSSPSGTELSDGVYVFEDEYPLDNFDFNEEFSYYGVGCVNGACIPVYFTEGAVAVVKNGNEYTLLISATDTQDNEVTGLFQGSLSYYDNSR